MQAWKSFDRFKLGTNCRAWLFRILFNKAHRHRKWLFWRNTHDSDELLLEALRYEPSVSEQLSDEEVLRALERLPHCYREVVLLADVEEFSYKEIAGILDAPIGTVMSRLSRGRRLLRVELAGMAESYGIKCTEKS